ncbi:MAG: hypothetical protein ACREJL_01425 [Candidatus Methylomirabilales bacterium]
MRESSLAILGLIASLALLTQRASAEPLTEPAFYNGQLAHFLLPSASNPNPNEQVVADCSRVGPKVALNVPVPAKACVLMIPGGDQETTCSTDGRPAGDLTHHYLPSAAPGDQDYNGKFNLVVIQPGPSYPGAAFADSYNSEAAVLAGILASELVVVIPDAAHVSWSVKLPAP